jgi:hypothetical protein
MASSNFNKMRRSSFAVNRKLERGARGFGEIEHLIVTSVETTWLQS